mgnify:CR=1 FL=1
MIKIGIIGIGRVGAQHLERLLESEYFKVVGCFDINQDKLQRIGDDFNIKCFDDVDTLIELCDAVDILTSADSHFFYAEKAIRFGKHVFIDKPISNNLEEAKRLAELVREAGVKFQIGHIERFNPAFLALQHLAVEPKLIEAHRHTTFDDKRTSDSLLFDVMINDIDIILSVVKANIRHINASGVSVLTDKIDVANVRIEFDNGCVANLNASRTATQRMKKMLFFQRNHQITLDFLHRETEVITLSETAGHNSKPLRMQENMLFLNSETLIPEEYDALKQELNSFAHCLIFNTEPKVSVQEGIRSLEIAQEILRKINKNNGQQHTTEQLLNVV